MSNSVRFVVFLSVIVVLAIIGFSMRDAYEVFWGPEIEIEAVVQLRFGTAFWNVTLRNVSKRDSYFNIEYRTLYEGESGKTLRRNTGTFTMILGPGETRQISGLNDGYVPQQVIRADMDILRANILPVHP